MKKIITTLAVIGAMSSVSAFADCTSLPNQADLTSALKAAIVNSGVVNGGFGLNMWATVVDRDGQVVLVCHSGDNRGDQWPGSRRHD